MTDLISKMITPKMGINIIRNQISKTLKKPVTDFEIIYFENKPGLKVKVEKNYYDLEADSLQTLIKAKAAENLKKEQILDAAKIIVQNDEISAILYFTENGVKTFLNYKL